MRNQLINVECKSKGTYENVVQK